MTSLDFVHVSHLILSTPVGGLSSLSYKGRAKAKGDEVRASPGCPVAKMLPFNAGARA